MLATLKIIRFILMLIGFTLETYTQVSIIFHHKSQHPFYQVDYIERQVTKLTHLGCVNALMVNKALTNMHTGMNMVFGDDLVFLHG